MRQHLEHLAAALGALAFALFVSYFNTGAVVHLSLSPTSSSHGKLSPIPADHGPFGTTTPSFEFSTSSLEKLFQPAKSATTTETAPSIGIPGPVPAPAKKPAPKSPAPTKPTPVPSQTSPGEPSQPSATTTAESGELAALKGSIVNILCISHTGSLRSISGSGVIIDSRGIILTAAHVAQVDLLESYLGSDKMSCTVRMGSPARSLYLAHPIYVSDAWIKSNPTTLISSQPMGTGEHDYALLAITSSVSGAPLPSFPAVPIAAATPGIGDTVYVGTYGSQELSGSQIQNALYPTLVASTIRDRFTFDTNTVDVLSIAGSAASQEGSSGGAVVDASGALVGIVTTSQISGPVANREMRAISTNYIRRSFASDAGKDFIAYFGDTSLTTLINSYAPTAQTLGQFVAQAIGLQ